MPFEVAAPFFVPTGDVLKLCFCHQVMSTLWILTIVVGVQWCLIVFISTSFMAYDVDSIFTCSFAIRISSLMRCVKFFGPLFCWVVFLLWSFKFVCIRQPSYTTYLVCINFVRVCGFSFHFLIIIFPKGEVLNFNEVSPPFCFWIQCLVF